ncbi:MAG: hypothetical protein F4Y07_00115 [Gemmatimonadetes bacterium]|nr:hypothetical protein [Gemmatimonadota bacterium]MXV95560.1 hypothetical protein [Gemmatimonadota bacterium]MYE14863.1 hypothetical protein [Gemmatimonadota bacterium]
MTDRRREYRILALYCGIGALVMAAAASLGILFPRTLWATVGSAVLGAWVGLAIYRLRSDSLI